MSSDVEDFDADYFRTGDQVRYDAMVEQARQVTEQARQVTELVKTLLERGPYGQTQTVIHKTAGMGAWGAAGVVACFFTYLTLIVLAVIFVPTIHDLLAWQDINRKDIARLQAQQHSEAKP